MFIVYSFALLLFEGYFNNIPHGVRSTHVAAQLWTLARSMYVSHSLWKYRISQNQAEVVVVVVVVAAAAL